jgi:tetratricopeptide (TPR) repeat protein
MAGEYRLVIQGVQPGHSVEQVATALAAQLARPMEQLLPALRSGQVINLNLKGLDVANALTFRNTVDATGCNVAIDSAKPPPPERAAPPGEFRHLKLRPFVSRALGLLLQAPVDWRDASEGDLFRIQHAGTDTWLTASGKRTPGIRLGAWAELRLDTVADKLPYLKPCGAPYSLRTAAGTAIAAEFRGTVPGEPGPTHQLVLCLCPKGAVASLNFTASAADYERHEALYQWLLRTQLRLVDSAAAVAGTEGPAAQYDRGIGLAEKGEMEPAAQWFRQAAEQGHPDAQVALGHCYLRGQGVARDLQQAFTWWRKAAEQGKASAQFNLASMYAQGDGTAKDPVQAFHWRLKAAEQDDAEAQYQVAIAYVQGTGVAQDLLAAGEWTRKAASRGHPGAMFYAGAMHERGEGLPRDPERALQWYEKAAAAGHAGAQERLRDLGL